MEVVGVEDDALPPMRTDGIPEVARVVMKAGVDIDHVGVPPRLVPNDPGRLVAGNIHSKGEPVADRLRPGRAIDQPYLFVQPAQRAIAEAGRTAADAELH